MKVNLKSRLTNYAFWTSLLALIPLVGQMLGLFELPAEYADLSNAILSFLVAAGIVNNPTTQAKWFLDDPQKEEK
nr:MAG TPA: holin [Caudoviricetes sp.]